jgi:hypothetical protein
VNNDSACGVGRLRGDSRQLQRERVGENHVAVVSTHGDRSFWRTSRLVLLAVPPASI